MTTILLVEDDDTSREMLSLRLELRGWNVVPACDGAQALETARLVIPSLVLLDMNLPVVDGWTVARKLREERETAQIPIIGVSAHAMAGDREKALAAGCNEYETKPVEWQKLLPKIVQLLETCQ